MRFTRFAVIFLLGTLLFTGVACQGGQGAEPTPTPTPTPTSTPEAISFLFVQEADSGTFEPDGDETYTLTLNDVIPYTIYFSDRPYTTAGFTPMQEFIDVFEWETPPNAAIVLKESGESEDTLIVQLFFPDYDAATQTLSYTVNILEEYTEDALGYFLTGKDVSIPQSFGATSLFIDNSENDLNTLLITKFCQYCDLSHADLTGADLTGAKLMGADLSYANLTGADLVWASLMVADLTGADLTGADLSISLSSLALLRDADLTNADLYGADFSWASFYGALFRNTDLSHADLTGADLRHTDLCDVTRYHWITRDVLIDEDTKCPP